MEIEITVKVDKDRMGRIQELISFSKVVDLVSERELPTTIDEIVNSALYYYLQKIDIWLSFHKYEVTANALDDDCKLKNNIKEIIKCMGIKQKELAKLTGIDDATISTMLTNRNQPSMENFLRIWSVLGNPPIEEMFYREKI